MERSINAAGYNLSRPTRSLKFLLHLLIAEKESLYRFGKGTTHTTIYFPEVKAFHVCLPPLAEQRRIVARIEALQARSRKAREAVELVPQLLEQFRQSVLAAAFRGDLTAEWREQHPDTEPASALLERIRVERRQKWEAANPRKKYAEPEPVDDADLPELPDGWCWATIQELAWASGYGTSTKCDYEGGGQPVLRIPNVANGAVNSDDVKFALEDLNLTADEWLRPGDFLIVRTNGSQDLIGRGAVVEGVPERPCYFASYLIRYRLLGGCELWRWLASLWQGAIIRHKLETLAATSAGQYNVSLGKLDSVAIPIPPFAEIQHLNSMLAAAHSSLNPVTREVNAALAEVGLLDQSSLATAFRGELVEQDPTDEPASALLARIRAGRNGTSIVTEQRPQPTPTLLATRYVVMLLRHFKLKVARPVLETCLVLMLDDDARKAILGKKPTTKPKKATAVRTHIPGLDHFLGELVTAKFLTTPKTIRNAQVFGLDVNAPTDAVIVAAATEQDKQRLKETLQALEVFGEEQARREIDAISHATYEFVSG